MNRRLISRRELLRDSVALGALGVAATAFALGCDKKPKELHCIDESALAPDEVTARHTLEYADKSPDPQKFCENCQQFTPPPPGKGCGGCKVVKGPINPKGHCKSWVAKPPTT
jgi:hypothetical protein